MTAKILVIVPLALTAALGFISPSFAQDFGEVFHDFIPHNHVYHRHHDDWDHNEGDYGWRNRHHHDWDHWDRDNRWRHHHHDWNHEDSDDNWGW